MKVFRAPLLLCKLFSSSAAIEIPSLISASEALGFHKLDKIKFVDGTWYLNNPKLACEEFKKERIPSSAFFNIDEISDLNSPFPHMLPTQDAFSEHVSNLGVSSDDHVVVYSKKNSFSSSRVWWTFKAFGHEKVSILNGGFEGWKGVGGEIATSDDASCIEKGKFNAVINKNLVANWEDVLKVVKNGTKQIIDARSKARFLAEAPEPRIGLQGGHIPGSLSLPFTELVDENDWTTFKSKKEIEDAFSNAGAVLDSNFVFTCGSGVSAAVLNFSLFLLGKDLKKTAIYDGSWSEWGSRSDLPKFP
jgi:thiosulfate/3-mercaptopyruvate sulfurtransferase